MSFVGEKDVSLLQGGVRKTNDSAAIADSRFGVQGAYFAWDGAFAALCPPVCAEHGGEKAVAGYIMCAQCWTIPIMSFSSFTFPFTARSKATTHWGKPIFFFYNCRRTAQITRRKEMSFLQCPTTATFYTTHCTSCQLLRYCITNINSLAFQSVTVHTHSLSPITHLSSIVLYKSLKLVPW